MVPLACIFLALSEDTLWTTVEALKSPATSTIFYWALFIAALLVSCLRHSPGNLLRQCGSSPLAVLCHVGVHDFAMVIGRAGVTAQARAVSGHKY